MPDRSFRLRPLNTPLSRIKLRQLTNGKEYMIMQEDPSSNFELVPTVEYIGLYHIYPNGAVYTGAVPTSLSQPLTRYFRSETNANLETINTVPENNLVYARLTDTRFYNYVTPTMHYPEPTGQQRANGIIKRYFAKKINASAIIEISPKAYQSENNVNSIGIDDELYNTVQLEWTIKGPIEEVRKTNQRVISRKESEMPGLRNFLSDLTEFHE
jgi:hypothetical protein